MPEQDLSPSQRAVIAKYLMEAHSKEQQLETALQAQISLAESPLYEHALIDHLDVTRRQIAALEGRVDELGGSNGDGGVAGTLVTAAAELATTAVNKGMALMKGPLQVLRGTSAADNDVRSIRDSYWNEAEEIAHYRVIGTIAQQLGDDVTAQLAQEHRKQEEAMQHTLEGLFPAAIRSVVDEEVSGGATG